jgi:PAS domain S-box-containing protein
MVLPVPKLSSETAQRNEKKPPQERPARVPQVLRAELHYGSPMFGYVLAIAVMTVTGALRLAEPGLSEFPFLFFYPAIAISSFLGGAGPGLAALLLGAVFASFISPYPPAPENWIALAVIGPLFSTGFAHLRYIRERNLATARELARFKFIGDHASDWILLLGESGNIRYVNLRAAMDLGWSGDALTGTHIESVAPGTQHKTLRMAIELARAGTPKPFEIAFERRDGSITLMEVVCTAVRTGEEQVIYAAARDINERRQIEKKLLEIRHWESLGALAGGLAHDFNNLLTSILGNASLAHDIVSADHETAPMLEGIISATERSADLVRLLLATAGYRSRFSEQLRLDQLLDWTLAHQKLPENVSVARDVAKEAETVPFLGDRRSFETLLCSLISNAAEAYGKERGQVRVAIRSGRAPALARDTRAARFEEGDPGPGECIGIVVEDRGSGMSPEVLNRAFDPFFSTRFTGRGLGLPAVRGIVRAYSGKLLLETAPGEGTRVEVWLPCSKN